MLDKIDELLSEFLPIKKINEIVRNFDDMKDVPLSSLGIDSLSMMGLVLKIEELYDVEIELDTFNMSELGTLNSIQLLIKR